MPTYEYECTKCGHKFDLFQPMKDDPIKKCPECKGKVDRLIGQGSGIIFKGSGFYETDYRSDSYKNTAKTETGVQKTAKKETKTETKTDSGVSTGSPQGEKKTPKPKTEKKSG